MNKYGFGVTAFWLISAFVCYINFGTLEKATHWHIHTYQVLDSSKNVSTAVSETQMNQRNYILTGDAVFKKKYEECKTMIGPTIAKTKILLGDSAEQQVKLARAEGLIQDRIIKWEKTIDAFDKGGIVAAQAAIKANQSNIIEELKTVLNELNDHEVQLLKEREKNNKESFDMARICTFVAFGVSLVMFLIPLVSVTKGYYAAP